MDKEKLFKSLKEYFELYFEFSIDFKLNDNIYNLINELVNILKNDLRIKKVYLVPDKTHGGKLKRLAIKK